MRVFLWKASSLLQPAPLVQFLQLADTVLHFFPMFFFLQRFTGTLFYLLAGSYFVGYLLLRNSIGGVWPGWWMQIADLPLALVGILYGGTSFYRTVHHGEKTSWGKLIVIAIPLLAIFAALVVLNFWEVLPVLQASQPL